MSVSLFVMHSCSFREHIWHVSYAVDAEDETVAYDTTKLCCKHCRHDDNIRQPVCRMARWCNGYGIGLVTVKVAGLSPSLVLSVQVTTLGKLFITCAAISVCSVL